MDEQFGEDVKKIASEVRKAIGDDFEWEWDSRFSGALTQFEKSSAPLMLDVLSRVCPDQWTVTNLDSAPEAVLIASDYLGGLRVGQQLLTTDSSHDPFIVVAIWPWGNGTTISVRIIPFGLQIPPGEMIAPVNLFRSEMSL